MTGVVAKPDKKVHPKSYGADRKDQGGGTGLVPARHSRRRAVLLADGGVETRDVREELGRLPIDCQHTVTDREYGFRLIRDVALDGATALELPGEAVGGPPRPNKDVVGHGVPFR